MTITAANAAAQAAKRLDGVVRDSFMMVIFKIVGQGESRAI
jgi:hypothetical protein